MVRTSDSNWKGDEKDMLGMQGREFGVRSTYLTPSR